MRLSREEIEHVALLSRLKLTEDEIVQFTSQLNTILGHFEELQEADTSEVSGTSNVVPLLNVMREDQQKTSFTSEEALTNAPEKRNDLFKVPRVVE